MAANVPENMGHISGMSYLENGVIQAIDVARPNLQRPNQSNVPRNEGAFCVGARLAFFGHSARNSCMPRNRAPACHPATLLTTMLDFSDTVIYRYLSTMRKRSQRREQLIFRTSACLQGRKARAYTVRKLAPPTS